MFYRKYRPQTFSELSKPNEVATALANQIANQKVGHAYLFIGPRGTGKTTTARILTKALNCAKISASGDACGECVSCIAIRDGKFFDLIEIDAASNRGIDDIRALKERVNLAPVSAKYKVYIIDEVHMLTMEAFNALLKTLEEPPKHAVFILCTTEAHKVPETIKSRCQVFKFKRATLTQIIERLEDIAKKENAKVSKSDLAKIAQAAYGGFRDGDTILQQVIEGSIDVSKLLGVSALESFVKLTSYIISGKTQAALLLINEMFDEGVDLVNWSNEYIKYLRDLLYIQAGFSQGVSDVTEDIFASMEEQSSKLSSIELVKIIDRFLKASLDIKSVNIPQLPLELAIVEVSESGSSDFVPEVAVGEGAGAENISSDLSLDSVLDSWKDILRDVKPYNHSVEALLRSCKPISLQNNALTLQVAYAFHKERLESVKSRQIIEKVFVDKFGTKIKVQCILKSKEGESLTDKNVEVPKEGGVAITEAAVDVFDGQVVL